MQLIIPPISGSSQTYSNTQRSNISKINEEEKLTISLKKEKKVPEASQ